jgi:4-amino-4-deoxychorismate lyase
MIYDEGFYFGLGAFETIAVEDGIPLFAEAHCNRLREALGFLGIPVPPEASCNVIRREAEQNGSGRSVLKLAVSAGNAVYSRRKNPYGSQDYKKGFSVAVSPILRNETSPFVRYKTLCAGENLWEKRRAAQEGFDEVIFVNTRGELTEGAVTNLFLVRRGEVLTPPASSGLLPGILRRCLLERLGVKEQTLYPEDLSTCDELFLSNSLMGIMPVRSVGKHVFSRRAVSDRLREEYRKLAEAEKKRLL